MPKLNGLEVLKSLREEESKPVIIVLTSITEEIYRQKCFEFGAKHVFAKGAELDEIVRVLREL
jgi:DNA-binding response OmpR family regulator